MKLNPNYLCFSSILPCFEELKFESFQLTSWFNFSSFLKIHCLVQIHLKFSWDSGSSKWTPQFPQSTNHVPNRIGLILGEFFLRKSKQGCLGSWVHSTNNCMGLCATHVCMFVCLFTCLIVSYFLELFLYFAFYVCLSVCCMSCLSFWSELHWYCSSFWEVSQNSTNSRVTSSTFSCTRNYIGRVFVIIEKICFTPSPYKLCLQRLSS